MLIHNFALLFSVTPHFLLPPRHAERFANSGHVAPLGTNVSHRFMYLIGLHIHTTFGFYVNITLLLCTETVLMPPV
jgi:hypothetical protein